MGIGKIFFGVMVLVIGISMWLMMATPQGALTQVMFSSPSARMSFSETIQSFQLLYFLVVIGGGIGLIIWGSQS
jgi:hypothetical protein